MNKKEMVCYNVDASRLTGSSSSVVCPRIVEEIQNTVKTSGQDIVPRGGGSNVVGGCIPKNSIVVDMRKFNKVTNFDAKKMTVYAEAGITMKELNEKLRPTGFEFPVYTNNYGISTLGGMIARNSAGNRSLKYGVMKDWIEEIEFVNGRGELMRTSKADLMDVCGMEGITGIIIGAKIKLMPLIERSASIFQTDDLQEALAISRRLKLEKEVVMLQFFPPYVSNLLGLPERYHLIVEFDSDRGKIRGEEYEYIQELGEKVYDVMYENGYYISSDPKFFFDKIQDFIRFLEEKNTPYFGYLGLGIIHPFFMDEERQSFMDTMNYLKKIKVKLSKYGIGTVRKDFIDSFERKIIQRVKLRHDPFLKLNKGKLIDADLEKSEKLESRRKIIERPLMPRPPQENLTENRPEIRRSIAERPLTESPAENRPEIRRSIVDTPEVTKAIDIPIEEPRKMDVNKDFNISNQRISTGEERSVSKMIDEFSPGKEGPEYKVKERDEFSEHEYTTNEVKDRLSEYEYTFDSELQGDKARQIEDYAKHVSKDIINKEEKITPGKVDVTDNLERRPETTSTERDLINQIMTNKFGIGERKSDKRDESMKKEEERKSGQEDQY